MEEYKQSDIWQYISLLSENETKAKAKRMDIINKYRETGIDDPIFFEIENLADQISKTKDYKNAKDFMSNLSTKMQDAFYISGLDHSLYKRD